MQRIGLSVAALGKLGGIRLGRSTVTITVELFCLRRPVLPGRSVFARTDEVIGSPPNLLRCMSPDVAHQRSGDISR